MGKRSTTPQQPKDRILDVPAEANRDKHMNYLAAEEGDNAGEQRKDNRTFLQKIFKRRNKKKHMRGEHALGFKHLPDDPRNLPTENTSMAANTVDLKKRIKS